MIISHKYRFIFVKTMKTAGTSIEVFLSQHCGPDDIVTPIIPHIEPHLARNQGEFFNHIPASEIRSRVEPRVWNEYYKFCVERNPWEKTLSYYHMLKHRQGGSLTFDDYLASRDFPRNVAIYTEPGNPRQLLVDRVLSYERLTADLSEVFQQLGIPFHGSLGVNAKSEYRSDRRPYQQVFSPAQADLVAEEFASEIALHGYRFAA